MESRINLYSFHGAFSPNFHKMRKTNNTRTWGRKEQVSHICTIAYLKCHTILSKKSFINVHFSWILTEECNAQYNCSANLKYEPVCDRFQNEVFFSSCHAGCQSLLMKDNITVLLDPSNDCAGVNLLHVHNLLLVGIQSLWLRTKFWSFRRRGMSYKLRYYFYRLCSIDRMDQSSESKFKVN